MVVGLVVGQVPVHGAVEIADRHAPSTLTEPSGCGRTPGTATSCSSVMSPTISSRMSSSVTRPITSPYSSTTSAKWRLAPAERLELLRQRPDIGHEPGRQRDRGDVDLGRDRLRRPAARAADPWRAGCRRCSPACRCQSGMRVTRRREHGFHDLFRRIVGVDRNHLGAVDHHVGNGRDRADRGGRPTCRDRASPRCLRGAAGPRRRATPRCGATGMPGRRPRGIRTCGRIERTSASIPTSIGPNSRTTHEIGRATSSATRSGALIATVLGSTSVKHDDHHGHDHGRIERRRHRRTSRAASRWSASRGRDVDDVVAESGARRSTARGVSSSRLTRRRAGCRASPCAACAHARSAVSAVSLAGEEEARTQRQSTITTIAQPVFGRSLLGELLEQESANLGGIDVAAR